MSNERRRGGLGLLITGTAMVFAGSFFKPSGLKGACCGSFLAAISPPCVEFDDIGHHGYAPSVLLIIEGLLLTGTSWKALR